MTLGLGLPIMLCLVKWNVYLTASVIKKPSSHLDPDLNLSCLERNIFFRQTETKTKIIVKNKNNQVLSQNHFPLDYFLLCLKSDQLRDKQNKERKTLTKTNFLLVYTISFFILERKRKLFHCKRSEQGDSKFNFFLNIQSVVEELYSEGVHFWGSHQGFKANKLKSH